MSKYVEMWPCEEAPAGKCNAALGSLVGLKVRNVRNVDLDTKELNSLCQCKMKRWKVIWQFRPHKFKFKTADRNSSAYRCSGQRLLQHRYILVFSALLLYCLWQKIHSSAREEKKTEALDKVERTSRHLINIRQLMFKQRQSGWTAFPRCSYLKGELCGFGEEIQTKNVNIYNKNELILQIRTQEECFKLERWQGPPSSNCGCLRLFFLGGCIAKAISRLVAQ